MAATPQMTLRLADDLRKELKTVADERTAQRGGTHSLASVMLDACQFYIAMGAPERLDWTKFGRKK